MSPFNDVVVLGKVIDETLGNEGLTTFDEHQCTRSDNGNGC